MTPPKDKYYKMAEEIVHSLHNGIGFRCSSKDALRYFSGGSLTETTDCWFTCHCLSNEYGHALRLEIAAKIRKAVEDSK